MRGATARARCLRHRCLHFNPRSSCEERRHIRRRWSTRANFNPRSSCEERLKYDMTMAEFLHFNPRSSCEERRLRLRQRAALRFHFNPRSSCEERQGHRRLHDAGRNISIHAPHARSDKLLRDLREGVQKFQSTLLMRGATSCS